MKFGLWTVCEYDNDAPEPEGLVLYDTLPEPGTVVTLSDKKEWVVKRFDKAFAVVYVERLEK